METSVLRPRQTQSTEQQFLQLIADPFSTSLQSDAIIASVGVSLGVTAFIALLFCLFRPYNTIVYAPRLRNADEKHAPPPIGRGIFAWVSPVVETKEQALCDKVGLDATVFIRFTKMCRNIFLVLSILGCGILIPVNVVVGGDQILKGQDWNVNALMRMTPQYMKGQIFWSFVVCAWVIDLVVCFFLWWNYRAVARLRRAYFESPEYQTSLHSRTVMVTEIPKNMRTDEGVVRLVDQAKGTGELPRSTIARNVKNLGDLIEEHEDTVRKLEEVLAKFLKKGVIPDRRPMCKPNKRDPEYKNGQKVDAIVYLTNRIQALETKIKDIRQSLDQRNALPYGFASYETIEEAHSVAYRARNKHPHGSTIKLAPRPADLIWSNLPMTPGQRRRRKVINNLWMLLLTLVWIAPNAMIAIFLSNLSNIGKFWQGFDAELHKDPKTWAVVQGVAAPAITSLFYFFLPAIFRRLAIKAGDTSKTSRDRHVFAKLYTFFTFNNLFVFSLFSAIWTFVATLISARNDGKNIHDAFLEGQFFLKTMIALCTVSPFWITWLLQRNLGAAIDLSQLVSLAWGSFARKFLAPTPRQLIEWSAPPPFDYANYYNYFVFYSTVALCFATLQPIVLPVTAFYFLIDSYLKKYLVLYVFYTKTESGGMFWRALFNRFLVAIFFSNLIVALIVVASGDTWITMLGALAPLPLLLIAFKWYCHKTFDDQIHFYTKGHVAREEVLPDNKSMRSTNVAVRFGHPAIYKPLLTPMVHERSKHLLSQVYKGRLDDDDNFDAMSTLGFSDTYGMQNFQAGKKSKGAKQQGPFEFVAESNLDFENFKNRADFRAEHGGEGDMYGRAEDAMTTRSATPLNYRMGPGGQIYEQDTSYKGRDHSPSQDSDVTLAHGGIHTRNASMSSLTKIQQQQGTTYTPGYHQTPGSLAREYSPSPVRRPIGLPGAWESERNLLTGAAPMGNRGASPYRRDVETPGSQGSGGGMDTPGGDLADMNAGYDYFRGRKR